MNIQPECVPCLLKRVLYETHLVDATKAYETVSASTKILSQEFREDANSAKVATKVHAAVYRLLRSRDLYSAVKKRCNSVALRLLPAVERRIRRSRDRFKSAVISSIVGNSLDFGISSPLEKPEELMDKFDELYREGLGHDDTHEIRALLDCAENVLFFADNAGEIILDKPLIREIKRYDVHLTLVVRGAPILTDATMDDVKTYGLDRLVDEVTTTNSFAVGVDFGRIGAELKRKLKGADLIISKGMANWESFSDENYRPIAYLLRAKCDPVARGLKVERDMNVAKLYG